MSDDYLQLQARVIDLLLCGMDENDILDLVDGAEDLDFEAVMQEYNKSRAYWDEQIAALHQEHGPTRFVKSQMRKVGPFR